MDNLKKLFTIGFFTLIILSGTLGGVFGVNNSVNNSSNPSVQPLLTISVSVNPPNLNLGTLMPDGTETAFMGLTSVSVLGTGLLTPLALYVRANGDFASGGGNIIPLSNFKYDGFNNPSLPRTSFSTSNGPVLHSWSGVLVSDTVPANYYLTVPTGTKAGNYTVQVIYTATSIL